VNGTTYADFLGWSAHQTAYVERTFTLDVGRFFGEPHHDTVYRPLDDPELWNTTWANNYFLWIDTPGSRRRLLGYDGRRHRVADGHFQFTFTFEARHNGTTLCSGRLKLALTITGDVTSWTSG